MNDEREFRGFPLSLPLSSSIVLHHLSIVPSLSPPSVRVLPHISPLCDSANWSRVNLEMNENFMLTTDGKGGEVRSYRAECNMANDTNTDEITDCVGCGLTEIRQTELEIQSTHPYFDDASSLDTEVGHSYARHVSVYSLDFSDAKAMLPGRHLISANPPDGGHSARSSRVSSASCIAQVSHLFTCFSSCFTMLRCILLTLVTASLLPQAIADGGYCYKRNDDKDAGRRVLPTYSASSPRM